MEPSTSPAPWFVAVGASGHVGLDDIGVILSGFLDDGSRGLAAIHHAGGLTMVLKPSGSAIPGMPENVISYDGPIDFVGSSAEIVQAIVAAIAPPKDRSRCRGVR